MRSRLILKLIPIVVMLMLSVIGARTLSSGSTSSSVNPADVARNGLNGICANEQAAAAAGGDGDPGAPGAPATAVSSNQLTQLQSSDPAGLHALEGAVGGSLSCATTTNP